MQLATNHLMILPGHHQESPKDISGLGLDELKALLVQALEENAHLRGRER